MKTQKCIDRVAAHLASRAEDFERFMNATDEATHEERAEYGLCFDYIAAEPNDCPACDGPPCPEECAVCGGSGEVDPGGVCPDCDGDGETTEECDDCDSTGQDEPTPGYYRYQLSWGGPSDEVRFYENGEIEYHFMDWFDGASLTITAEDWAVWLRDDFTDTETINWDRARELDAENLY